MDDNIPIWPVQGPSIPPTYRQYKEILIAPPDVTVLLLGAFASVGLAITQPPQDVYNLVYTIQRHRLLTPELAHAALLVRFNHLCAAVFFFIENPFPDSDVGFICDS